MSPRQESGGPFIDQVYVLQGYTEGWKEGAWEEKIDSRPCIEPPLYSQDKHEYYRGWFWGYEETRGLNVSCLSVQGSASIIAPVLLRNTSARSVMLDRAENLLHDHYGGKEYWDVSVASSVCVNAYSLGNMSLPPNSPTHTHMHTQSSSCVHLLPNTVRPSIWGWAHWQVLPTCPRPCSRERAGRPGPPPALAVPAAGAGSLDESSGPMCSAMGGGRCLLESWTGELGSALMGRCWLWRTDGAGGGPRPSPVLLGWRGLVIRCLVWKRGAVLPMEAQCKSIRRSLRRALGYKVETQTRRSMVFARHLRAVGDEFRSRYLNSTDVADGIPFEEDWTRMKVKLGSSLGGPYLGVHLRRKDFIWGHREDVPSLDGAVRKIRSLMKAHQLDKVFVATDAVRKELEELRRLLPEMVRFEPTWEELELYKDGGVAIVDQWICAHARFFIGTSVSTFSFRIHEEREILGLDPKTTYNRFCGDEEKVCEQPTHWRIAY